MKYRIKIITYKNGKVVYIPQVKFFCFWDGCDTAILTTGKVLQYENAHDTRDEALAVIDRHYQFKDKKQTIEFEYINK